MVILDNLIRINHFPESQRAALRPAKFGLWNSQSIRNKTTCFVDYICSNTIDLFTLTETWFTDLDAAAKTECIPDGYKMSQQSRSGRRGGDIALVYRSDIPFKKVEVGPRSSFEISEFTLANNTWRMRIAVIYRPPYSSIHPVTPATFFTEFADYLE